MNEEVTYDHYRHRRMLPLLKVVLDYPQESTAAEYWVSVAWEIPQVPTSLLIGSQARHGVSQT